MLSPSMEGKVFKNGKWGVMNRQGVLIQAFVYAKMDGQLVKKNKKYG